MDPLVFVVPDRGPVNGSKEDLELEMQIEEEELEEEGEEEEDMELVLPVVSSSFSPATRSPTVSPVPATLSLSHLDPEIRPGERLVVDDSTGMEFLLLLIILLTFVPFSLLTSVSFLFGSSFGMLSG
jgi:hypothetical protein